MRHYPVRTDDSDVIVRHSLAPGVDVPRYLAEVHGSTHASYALAQALTDAPNEPNGEVQAAVGRVCSGKVTEVIEHVERIILDLRFADADARYARAWLRTAVAAAYTKRKILWDTPA